MTEKAGARDVSLGGVDLNLLPALDALLTERNVTRAAERMSLGQPAMSAALGRLRKQFGDPLLVREGREYTLTTLAESLVGPVREAVTAADAVLGVRKPFDPSADQRSFSVLTSDYVALVLLRPLLAELADEAPGVRINIGAAAPDTEDRLPRGTADLFICPTELAGPLNELPHTVLFEDRYILAADRDNPDVDDDLDIDRFARLPYLTVHGATPSTVETQLDALGVPRRTEVTTETFVIAPLLLTGTRLVSFVQERLALSVAAQARLRLVHSPVALRPLIEAMYWNPRNSDDPGHRWLRTRLIQQAERI